MRECLSSGIGHRREGREQVIHHDARMARGVLALCLFVHAATALGLSASEVFRRAAPSVVVVLAMDESDRSKGIGGGVVVAQDRVITNCHVSDTAALVYVKCDGERLTARVIERAADKDLCLLQVSTGNAPVARLRRGADLQIGEPVYAIGNPQGLEQTLSPGLISQLRQTEKGLLLQTTAPISPGSSGGGLFDEAGLLIGITVGQFKDAQNLNFAIPVDWIEDVLRKQTRQAEPPPQTKATDPQRLPAPGQSFRDCAQCPEMVVVPAGRFLMGSPENEPGRDGDEGPQHLVTIANPFAVGKFEVTFEEWGNCVREGQCTDAKDEGWGRERRPVINVNYEQAVGYAEWLSKKTGKKYRLLSEAEWEYAARAGSDIARFWGSGTDRACEFANVYDATSKAVFNAPWENFRCDDGYANTAPAGPFKPNAFGLYDMLGNVREWVEDCWNDSYASAPADGRVWTTGDCSRRVFRGGGWSSRPAGVRSAIRYGFAPAGRYNNLGFRVARTLP